MTLTNKWTWTPGVGIVDALPPNWEEAKAQASAAAKSNGVVFQRVLANRVRKELCKLFIDPVDQGALAAMSEDEHIELLI